jgi:hypothetical protein
MASLTETDIQIANLEHTIAGVEAHLSTLRQKMCRLKTARNTFMPLMRLPNELLISVATLVALNSHDRFNSAVVLSSICNDLRLLYIATPELWRRISAAWGRPVIKQFATRASPLLLHMSVQQTDFEAERIVRRYMSRIESLHIHLLPEEDDSEDSNSEDSNSENSDSEEDEDAMHHTEMVFDLMDTLKSKGAPRLRDLEITDESDAGWRFSAHSMHPKSGRALTSLILRDIMIEDPPDLPVLRMLNLAQCQLGLRTFHQLLSRVPLLEYLKSWGSIKTYLSLQDMDTTFTRPQLSELRDVVVEDRLHSVLAVLPVLPDPSRTLVVHVEDFRFRNEPVLSLESLLAPFRNVWDRVAGPTARFPAWKLCRKIDSWSSKDNPIYQSFISLNSYDTSRTSFQVPLLMRDVDLCRDPFWSEIHVMHLDYDPHRPGMNLIRPELQELDVTSLGSINELVIEHGHFDPATDEQGITMMVDWITNRYEQEIPLRGIEFRNCSREATMPLVQRLEATGVAPPMTWVE